MNSVGDDSTSNEECGEEGEEDLLSDLCSGHNHMQRVRQYAVQYIINSAAGFYVFDVRLTTAMVLRVMYVSGALVFGLVTNGVTQE